MTTYTTNQAAALVGSSYRMVDYWRRAGVLVPMINAAGSGSQCRWTDEDVRALRVVVALSRLGAKSPVLTAAVAAVRSAGFLDRWLLVNPEGHALAGPVAHLVDDLGSFAAAWRLDLQALGALPAAPALFRECDREAVPA